jgi:threonine dehydrogenase-like Zn-dependent dehydrogenase
MWTATLELTLRRVIATRLLGLAWPDAYFSSIAPLRVENLPRQALPAAGWVRVRNRLAGICGSDLHLICADGDFRIAPAALPSQRHHYLGHEVVGEVIEIGEGVEHIQPGDRVVLQYSPNCISTGVTNPCHFCLSGQYNLCEYGELPGPQPIGGGWSEEMLLHEQQLFRVPDEITDEQAVMIEPTAVAVHAVLRRLPRPDERVLIIGAGTIGLLTLQVLRALAPQTEISVLARHPFQIEQAVRMGAAHIIYSRDSYTSVRQVTGAQMYTSQFGNQALLGGYDVIYDTIGQRKTLHDSLRWARARGAVVVVGISLHLMNLDISPLWYQEVDLLGATSHGKEVWPGSHEECTTFSMVADLIKRKRIQPESLITHHFALSDYQHALQTAIGKAESRAIKVVFDYALQAPSVVPNVRAAARKHHANSNTHGNQAEANRPVSADPDDVPTEKRFKTSELQREPLTFMPSAHQEIGRDVAQLPPEEADPADAENVNFPVVMDAVAQTLPDEE